jgi:hypothetical protein
MIDQPRKYVAETRGVPLKEPENECAINKPGRLTPRSHRAMIEKGHLIAPQSHPG